MDQYTDFSNVPLSIKSKICKNLHNKNGHPICIMKNHIYNYFKNLDGYNFETFDELSPYVSVENNFDQLLIPKEHPSRSKSDTYYVSENVVLRTHTSAHQNELLSKGHKSFLVSGDVYRKDEIDKNHYNVFHQLEGVHIVENDVDPEEDLKKVLTGLVEYLYPGREYRFNSDYFPFTDPSFEVEVKFGDKWLEILGCGVMHHKILDNLGIHKRGWALGLGVERLCMIAFNIPDIRLFWTDDVRFYDQFKENKIVEFKPYPKLESLDRDISFWLKTDDVEIEEGNGFKWKNINNFYELLREICGDVIENVNLYDKFFHKKKNSYSHTFKLTFSPNIEMNNSAELFDMANKFMSELYEKVKTLNVEPR
jgi:phenylalanyl-tRNA synthetase alpha chain